MMVLEGRERCHRQGQGKKRFTVHSLPAVPEDLVEGFGEAIVEGVEW